MARGGNKPRRESKKLPKHALEEISDYKNSVKHTNEFVKIGKLDFELTSKQKSLLSILDKNKIITVTGPPGTSKAQPLDAKILTPNGWVLMGDISVGDSVISVDGSATKVLGVYPQGKKKIFKISFSDGSSTECTEEHLWLTWTHDERNYRKKKNGIRFHEKHEGTIRTTGEMIGDLIESDGRLKYSIPIVSPIEFDEKDFILEPYLLGSLIGDGFFGNHIGFSTNDKESYDKINNILFKSDYILSERERSGDFTDCAIVHKKEKNKKNIIKEKIGKLGLLNKKSYDKFIPEEYLFGSISQRIELLQGLLDTDGCATLKGSVTFSTSSSQLKDDFIKLIQSLGGVCKYKKRNTTYVYNNKKLDGAPSYQIHINLPNEILCQCFSLSRKQEKVKFRTKYHPSRFITSIEEVREDEAQCILIEDKSHLYLTDNYIVTHNTFIACYAATQALLAGKCKKIILSKPTEVLSGTRDPGALPGSLEEKMAVFAESFIDSFEEFLSSKDFKHLWNEKLIEFKPAQFLRGRSLKDSYIIIDEFQNFDIKALKSIVTRLGRNSKIVFMGDTRQNDINKKYVAVDIFSEIISTIDGCANFKFERKDIVREQILIDIIDRFEKFEDEGKLTETIKGT